MKKPINVLVVDDSKTCSSALRAILESEPDIKVIACAHDGLQAVELTCQLKPDLITMDVFMPKMDGVAAISAIMKQCPTPILVISSPSNNRESKFVFDALQAGALSVIEKPPSFAENNFDDIKNQILNSIRTLVKVRAFRTPPSLHQLNFSHFEHNPLGAKLVALGASTGGPQALRCIISALSPGFPLPIVITQHITKGFLPGLINWLQSLTPLKVQIAAHKQKLEAGSVYFAPDNLHLIIKNGISPVSILDDSPKIDLWKPSINALFSSIAESYPNAAIGGLLTGMGKDGAKGLLKMKEAGCITFAQSESTSAVYGMPCAATDINAIHYSVDLEKIPQFLARLVNEGGE